MTRASNNSPIPFDFTPLQLSGVSKLLGSGQERGLREGDLQAIMKMMGPSDLSDLEDEVKVIQQNVRAWILRCNYKSLRKAAKTLQVLVVVVVLLGVTCCAVCLGPFCCATVHRGCLLCCSCLGRSASFFEVLTRFEAWQARFRVWWIIGSRRQTCVRMCVCVCFCVVIPSFLDESLHRSE